MVARRRNKGIRGIAIKLRTWPGILAILLIVAALLLLAVSVGATIYSGSANAAGWLSGLAVEYTGSPLWSTLAGIALIVLIVSLIMWLRRPRKPLDTHVPQ
jgi:hypothetical protein